jgi:hypothetical protein
LEGVPHPLLIRLVEGLPGLAWLSVLGMITVVEAYVWTPAAWDEVVAALQR